MSEAQTATIQTDVPVRLLTEMQTLVEEFVPTSL